MKQLLVFLLTGSALFCQENGKIKEIKELYIDYQNGIINKGSDFTIYFNDEGETYTMQICIDHDKKVIISSKLDHETADYDFKSNSLRFVFSENNESLDHWSQDTIRFRQWENRYYLSEGKIIKAIVKEYFRIEGKDKPDMTKVPNNEFVVTPYHFNQKAKNLVSLYQGLHSFYIGSQQ